MNIGQGRGVFGYRVIVMMAALTLCALGVMPARALSPTYNVSVTASPTVLPLNGTSTLTAYVTKAPLFDVMAGVSVTFSTSRGTVNPTAVTTNAQGSATTTLSGGAAAGQGTVTASVTIDGHTYSSNATVWVVSVDKMQYKDSSGAWQDVSGTLYVPVGTTVEFKAVKSPANAPSWPAGTPIWSGSAGANGTGETKAVTFTTSASSMSDTKTVVVTAGNTKTASVVAHPQSTGLVTIDASQEALTGEVYADVSWNCWSLDENNDYIADDPNGGTIIFRSLDDWNDLDTPAAHPFPEDITVEKLRWSFVSGQAGTRNITMVDGIIVADEDGEITTDEIYVKAPNGRVQIGRYASAQADPDRNISLRNKKENYYEAVARTQTDKAPLFGQDPGSTSIAAATLQQLAIVGAQQALSTATTTVGDVVVTITPSTTITASNPAIPAGSSNSVSVAMATSASFSGNKKGAWWITAPQVASSVQASPGTISVNGSNFPCQMYSTIVNRFNSDSSIHLNLNDQHGWGNTYTNTNGVAAGNHRVYGLGSTIGRTHFGVYYYGQALNNGTWKFGFTKRYGLNGIISYFSNPHTYSNQLENGQQIHWP